MVASFQGKKTSHRKFCLKVFIVRSCDSMFSYMLSYFCCVPFQYFVKFIILVKAQDNYQYYVSLSSVSFSS